MTFFVKCGTLGAKKGFVGESMAILQGNTYQVPVKVTDCRGEVIVPSMVEKGQFVLGSLEKFYGDGGEVWWSDELQAFMVPLTEEETFAFKGVVKYQARLLLRDGSISGSIPQSEYIRESITDVRLSESGAGVQSGSILKASLLKEVASVISDVVVDEELDASSGNAITNSAVANAINRVEAIAKGASQAIAYKTYEEAVTAINELGADAYNIGQNVMIFTLSVPDLWVSGVEETSQPYVYVDDDAIVNSLKTDGSIRVGYYTLSALETGKVDLENYYTKSETDVLLESLHSSVETLTGTTENPINFANLEIGKLYLLSGVFRMTSYRTATAYNILMFKATASSLFSFNSYVTTTTIIASVGAMSKFVINSSTGYVSNPEASVGIGVFNGSRRNSSQSFYAPLSAGTSGQILVSTGTSTNLGPKWVDMPLGELEVLSGTTDNPVSLGDLEIGKLYLLTGTIKMNALNNYGTTSQYNLAIRVSETFVVCLTGHVSKDDTMLPVPNGYIIDADGNVEAGKWVAPCIIKSINAMAGGYFAKLFAPTSGGTAGQILQSNGNSAPTWVDASELDAINLVDKDSRKALVLGATGTIEEGVANFVVEDADSYIDYRNNLTEFIFSGIIPITGEVDLTKEVTITFGDTSYYLFSAVDTSKHLTLGDLDFALKESLATGYNYLFRTIFFENSDVVGFAVMPDKEDVLSLTSDEMDNYMAEGGLPDGQLAICNKVITNGYTEGGVYRFKITYPSTYEWEELVPSRLRELTLTQSGSMLQSTQTFVGQHIHAMIEFDTDGVHYGADFILHPCDSAICLVSYRFGTHDGTAYLDDSGRVNISIPDSLSFTNFKGHYIKL